MMNCSISDVKRICCKQETHDSVIITTTRKISPYLTWVLLKLGFSANQTTILGMVVGSAGAVMLAFNSMTYQIGGILLLHLSNLLDYSDGEIARFNNHFVETKRYDISGAYLDYCWHFYIPTATIFAIALGVYSASRIIWVMVFGFIAMLGFCIFPFSCKEHILIDQLRRHPDLVENQDFRVAMLDRPEHARQASKSRRSLCVTIKKQAAEWVYYPSFFNALTIIIFADIITSGHYFRFWYLAVIALIVLAHQVIKIRNTFFVLKNIRYRQQ